MKYQHPQKHSLLPAIGVVIVFLSAFVAYDYFSTKQVDAVDDPLIVSDEAESRSPLSSEEVNLLNRIDALRLKDTIFRDPNFIGLKDWEVDLGTMEAGKTNPFAPLSGSAAPRTSTTRR
jgi:hypothetical protein